MIKPIALFHPDSGGGSGTPVTGPVGLVPPINGYVTLDVVKESLRAAGSAGANSTLPATTTIQQYDDADLLTYIFQASRALDSYARRRFYPFRQSRLYDIPPLSGQVLGLDEDLLQTITFTNGNGTAFTASQYTEYSPNYYPRHKLMLIPTAGAVWQYSSSGNNLNVISVDAIWGYHDDYGNAWTLASAINNVAGYNSTATTMTVDSIGAGIGVTIQAGNIIRFGTLATSEFARVSSIGSATSITVVRGINGSTAAIIADDTPIYVYNPMGLVQQVTRMATIDIYRKRAGAAGEGGTVSITGAGIVIRPAGFPIEMRDALEALTRRQ